MNSLLAVFRFELKRILTPGRSVWWLMVAAFPVVITLLIRTYIEPQLTRDVTTKDKVEAQVLELARETLERQEKAFNEGRITGRQLRTARRTYHQLEREVRGGGPPVLSPEELSTMYTVVIYFLAPSIACMLGALLTSAPSVASELEQHSWTYLATRPNGLFYLVMGKYLVAVLWSSSATIVGVVLSLPFSQILAVTQNGMALVGLAVLSSMCYSALYMTIGALFPQRAMIFCVAYTAAVELGLGSLPVVVNRLTIQYRLRSLLYYWADAVEIDDPDVLKLIASNEGPMMQLLWLAALTAVLLGVALTCVQVREFTTAAESEV